MAVTTGIVIRMLVAMAGTIGDVNTVVMMVPRLGHQRVQTIAE